MVDLAKLVSEWLSLGGFAAAIAILISILKIVKVVKDGQSANWSIGFNLAGLVTFYLLKLFRPDIDVSSLDVQAGEAASTALTGVLMILTYVMQLGVTKASYENILKGLPIIGKSFSLSK